MEEVETGHNGLTDSDQVSKSAVEDAEPSQRIVRAFCERPAEEHGFQMYEPLGNGQAFMEFGNWMLADPVKLTEAQAELMLGCSWR